MFDPLSTLSAPPPRYLLESDSSDEEGQGLYPSSSRRKTTAAPVISVRWNDEPLTPTTGIVGVGQAGKYLARRANVRMAVLGVEVNGENVGTGFAIPDGILVLLNEVDEKGEGANEVVEKLTQLVNAKSWTVFSSYVPALYIPDPTEGAQLSDPPVRCLTVGVEPTLKRYDAPNYVTGIPAALLSQATHPAYSLSVVSVCLLPLPLSLLSPASFAAALDTLPPSTAAAFAKSAHWTEADDEPYVALGMGARRPAKEAVPSGDDFTAMYM